MTKSPPGPEGVAQRWLLYLSATLLVGGAIALVPHGNFLHDTAAVPGFWRAMAIMNLGFVLSWALPRHLAIPGACFWGVAVATRMAALGMYPGDDVWRYLWEGYIQTQGMSPFDWAPDAAVLEPLRTGWWSMINHKDVSAIYPPLTQLGFWAISLVSSSVHLFKLAFIAADLGICALLSRRFGAGATLLYAWNPLVIYCFAGGAHYDSWFLLPLVMAWLWWDSSHVRFPPGQAGGSEGRTLSHVRFPPGQAGVSEGRSRFPGDSGAEVDRPGLALPSSVLPKLAAAQGQGGGLRSCNAAFWLGCSIAVKWMSLPILGFLVWQHFWWGQWSLPRFAAGLKQGRWLGALGLGCLGLLPAGVTALPYCSLQSCPLVPTGSVFVSHGRSAEWIPHWVAQVWPPSLDSNSLYAFPLVLIILWLLLRARSFGQFAEGYFIALLLLSPIIHAWYFTWLVPFAVASRNWGTKFVSISALIYFVLPYQVALGDPSWWMTQGDRLLLWLPFCLGLVLSALEAQGQWRGQTGAKQG